MLPTIPASQPLCKSDAVYKAVQVVLNRTWKCRKAERRIVGPKAVAFERHHLFSLQKNPSNWLVGDKTDGVFYLLVLAKVDRQCFAVMLNRKFEAFEISVYANAPYFRGSVFVGELVSSSLNSKPRQLFIAWDCFCLQGESQIRKSYIDRYLAVKTSLAVDSKLEPLNMQWTAWEKAAREAARWEDKLICTGNDHYLQFKCKVLMPLTSFDMLLRYVNTVPYCVDGLMFTDQRTEARPGLDETVVKYKHTHTLDFWLRGRHDQDKQWTYKLVYAQQGHPVVSEVVSGKDQEYKLKVVESSLLLKTIAHFEASGTREFSLLGECQCTIPNSQKSRVLCVKARGRKPARTIVISGKSSHPMSPEIPESKSTASSSNYGYPTSLPALPDIEPPTSPPAVTCLRASLSTTLPCVQTQYFATVTCVRLQYFAAITCVRPQYFAAVTCVRPQYFTAVTCVRPQYFAAKFAQLRATRFTQLRATRFTQLRATNPPRLQFTVVVCP